MVQLSDQQGLSIDDIGLERRGLVLKFCNQCMFQLLRSITTQYSKAGDEITYTSEELDLKLTITKKKMLSFEVSKTFTPDNIFSYIQQPEIQEIDLPHLFLKYALFNLLQFKEIDRVTEHTLKIFNHIMTQERHYHLLLANSLGCPAQCPFCARKCLRHYDHEGQHTCGDKHI